MYMSLIVSPNCTDVIGLDAMKHIEESNYLGFTFCDSHSYTNDILYMYNITNIWLLLEWLTSKLLHHIIIPTPVEGLYVVVNLTLPQCIVLLCCLTVLLHP